MSSSVRPANYEPPAPSVDRPRTDGPQNASDGAPKVKSDDRPFRTGRRPPTPFPQVRAVPLWSSPDLYRNHSKFMPTQNRADRLLMNIQPTRPWTLRDRTRALFYWELSATQQGALRSANLILEDEGYLAHDINRGRRLLNMAEKYSPVPDVASDWAPPERAEVFSDAIAAILQVAVDGGFDPEDLVSAALLTQSAVRSHATGAIRRQ